MMLACSKQMANSRAWLATIRQRTIVHAVYTRACTSVVLLYLGGNVRGKYENAQWIPARCAR